MEKTLNHIKIDVSPDKPLQNSHFITISEIDGKTNKIQFIPEQQNNKNNNNQLQIDLGQGYQN